MIIAPEVVMNPGGPKSGTGTPHLVNEFMSMSTDELLQEASEEGSGKRKQDVLKALVCLQVPRTINYRGLMTI